MHTLARRSIDYLGTAVGDAWNLAGALTQAVCVEGDQAHRLIEGDSRAGAMCRREEV